MGNLKKSLLVITIILTSALLYKKLPKSKTKLEYPTQISFTAVGHSYGYRGRMSYDLYKPLNQTLKNIDVGDLVLFLGDNVEQNAEEYYRGLFADLDNISGVRNKYYLSPGNHDISSQSERKRFLEFNKYQDTDYFFDRDGVRFISIDYSAYDKNTGKLPNIGGHNIMPEISKGRLKTLKKYLSVENLKNIYAVVIFTHTYVWDKNSDGKTVNIHQNTKFMENIFPLLTKTNKTVIVVAGNTCDPKKQIKENVIFITTGICSGISMEGKDNILKVSLSKNSESSKVKFENNIIYLQDYYDYSNIRIDYKSEQSSKNVHFVQESQSNDFDKITKNLNIKNAATYTQNQNGDLIYIFTQDQTNPSNSDILVIRKKNQKIIGQYQYEFSETGEIIASLTIDGNLLNIENRNNFFQIRHIKFDGDEKIITGDGIYLLKKSNFWNKDTSKDNINVFYDTKTNLLHIKNLDRVQTFQIRFVNNSNKNND